jgi:hypothetical protein
MIQRIQTVYLLLVAVLAAIVCFLPVAAIQTSANIFDLTYKGFVATPPTTALQINTLPFTILSALIPLTALGTIFAFKKRRLQMSLCIINFLLMDAYYIVMIASLWFADNRLALSSTWVYHFAAILPVVNMILSLLAYKSIQKDDKLVRSLDRLR